MDVVERAYRQRTVASAQHSNWATNFMPAGETRAAGYHRPYPLAIAHGAGAHLTDVDGNDFWDLSGNYTSLVHGHAHPLIVEAATKAIRGGTGWPACNRDQAHLAELLVNRVTSVEQVRFTNSGSEAAMLAMNMARVVTGRPKILMARFGYHGSHEVFEHGSFGGQMSTPMSDHPYLFEYNNPADVEQLLADHGDHIAAVFLEPVMGSAGIVTATQEFMTRVQAAARKNGSLFVIDEVITFRLDEHGAQSKYDIDPDLTLFAKTIGGGFPVGAVGGKHVHMAVLDPRSPRIFHSGTFNGNPVSMAAGRVSVEHLTDWRIAAMARLAERLESNLLDSAARHQVPFSVRRNGSLMNIYFTADLPAANLARADGSTMSLAHLSGLNHGLYFASRGMLVLSTVMTEDDIANISERFDAVMADVAHHLETTTA